MTAYSPICIAIKNNQLGESVPTITYKDENLRKNGVTRAEVREVFVLDLSFADDLDPSDRGNDALGTLFRMWTVDC